MACCSFACAARTVSRSSRSDWMLSARLGDVTVGKHSGPRSPAEGFCSRAGRFSGSFRVPISVSAVAMIVFPSSSSHELVAHSMHGQKKTGLLRNRLQLLSNAHDMSIYRAGGRKILITPNLVKQPLATERFSGVTKEMFEQIKFLTGKLHRVAATSHLVTPQIHFDITKGVAFLIFGECLCTPQDGFHASEQIRGWRTAW